MPYAIHLRKSRADLEAEARGEGESLSRHHKRLTALAERLQLPVVAVYKEIISGDKLSERPEAQRLLNDVAAGKYEGVLTVEVSRLTRGDLMDQGLILNTFKYSGTKIITPEHTYNLADDFDEDIITSDMMMARREYKYIKKRMQRGRWASAAEGLWQGPAPYGYKKVKIQRGKGWTLEIDPEAAPFVRMIFDMYANDRVGGATIADQLNALGSRTARGNLWEAGSVRDLSTNPVYVGSVCWGKRISVPRMVDGQLVVKREPNENPSIVKGKHPGIVSLELWEAVQRIRKANDVTRNHVSAPVRNPLAGLVVCSVCGRSMVRKDNCGGQGSKYDMLRCAKKGCPTAAIALSIVEQSIMDVLQRWSVDVGEDPSEETSSSANEQIEAARSNLARLQAQRERIFAAYEDGAYDSSTFIQRRNDKDAEIAVAEQILHDLEHHAQPTSEEIIRMQLPQIRHVLDAYLLTPEPIEKNKLLKTLIDKIVYSKTVRCYRNQDPAKFLTLEVFPRIPAKTERHSLGESSLER